MIAVAFALVLGACGNGDGITPPEEIDAEGTWSGTFPVSGGSQDVSLTLVLTETDGAVTGTGTLVTSAGSFPLTVSGTYDAPRLALGITTPGFDPVSVVAIVGEQSMTGTIGGGGFNNETFTLDRQ
jgi:hypothetical protein